MSWLSPLWEWDSLTITFLGKFGYIYSSPFCLVTAQSLPVPYGHWEGCRLEHSVLWLRICLSIEGAKNVFWVWLCSLRGWDGLTMTCFCKFRYISLTICGLPCEKSVLKMFFGPGFCYSEDGIVWLWHSLVNLNIYIVGRKFL